MGRELDNSHVGRDVPWADSVDLDVLLAPFVAEGLGQLSERALGGSVRGNGEPALHVCRCKVQKDPGGEGNKRRYCQHALRGEDG